MKRINNKLAKAALAIVAALSLAFLAEIATASATMSPENVVVPAAAMTITNVFHEGGGKISILLGDGSILSEKNALKSGQTIVIFSGDKKVADANVTSVSLLSTLGKISKLHVNSLDSYLIGDRIVMKSVLDEMSAAKKTEAEEKIKAKAKAEAEAKAKVEAEAQAKAEAKAKAEAAARAEAVANAKRENEAKAKAQAEAKAKAEAEAKAKSEAKAKDNAEKQKKAEIAAAKAKEQIIPESAKVATNVFHEGDGVISILEGDGSVLSGQLKPSLGQTVAIFKDGKRVADAQVTHVSILSTYGKITKLYVKSLDSYLIGDKVAVKNVVAAVPEASVVHAEIKPEPKIEPKPERAEAAASDAKVTVNGIKFSGNSVVETADLERVADKKRSGEMSLAEMRAIADSVAEYYRAQGYFLAKAVIPEQDIAGGIVNIEVLEGKLGKVHILGAAYYSEEYLQAFFNHIRKQGVIRKNNLERALLIMNSLPGLKVTSALKAGEQKGTTDIVVTVEEGDRLLATLEMDNFGSRYARVRALAGLDFISPLRRGDACSLSGLSGISSDKLYYFTANCSIPVDANGTSIGFYGLTGDFGVGREFAALNIQGEASAVGASVNRVLKINKNGSSVGELGLDAKKSRQDVLGAVSSEDSIVSLRLTMKNNVTDRSGRTFVGATIQHGLGEALGGMDDKDPMSSRAAGGADNSFTKMTFEAARAQYLSDKAFLLARLVAQATNESVVAGEQFGIGGANSVRGFSQAVYSGDDGGQISLEARMATSKEQLEKLQFVTFVDLGHISVKKPVLGQVGKKTIVGGGVGFRAYPIEGLFIMADFGFPLGGKTDNDDSFVPYLKLTRSF